MSLPVVRLLAEQLQRPREEPPASLLLPSTLDAQRLYLTAAAVSAHYHMPYPQQRYRLAFDTDSSVKKGRLLLTSSACFPPAFGNPHGHC